MEISISVRLRDKHISIMAIPFLTPEGVGPVIDANNNNLTRSNTQTVGPAQVTQVPNSESPASTGTHTVETRDSATRINLETFPRHLLTELTALYNSFCVVPAQPIVANNTSPISPISMASVHNQDNQGSSSSTRADQVVSGPQQQPSLLPLPDIIQCHAGLSLEASYRGSRVRRRRTNSQVNDDARRLTPGRSSNNTEHADRTVDNGRRRDQDDDSEDEEEFNSDWTVELKLLVGPWRRAGMELRAIADQYQLENSRRRQRENSSGSTRRSFRLRLAVNVALPAAAVLALGYSWLRRH